MRTAIEKIAPLLLLPLVFEIPLANAETCEETLKLVQQLYSNTVDKCGDNPASNCSGLIIRATTRAAPPADQTTHVWNPGKIGQKLTTSAFSYMRQDITYDKPGRLTENGYIKTPIDFLCESHAKVDIQCAFPKDAWTDGRTDKGCGDNIGNPADPNAAGTAPVEKACQDMGIKNGSEWVAHFSQYANMPIPDQYQCGFGLMNDRSKEDRTRAFLGFMDARKLLGPAVFRTITEVRIANPAQDQMPILAFFKTAQGGSAEALKNQQDYLAKTGNWRPIIEIAFPTQPGGAATFSCAANQTPRPANLNSTPGFCSAGRTPSPGFGAGNAPAQCSEYIKSVKWVSRRNYYAEYPGKEIWALEVIPNECGRKFGRGETDAVMAEMRRKAFAADTKGAEFWGDKNQSMRRQAICLKENFGQNPKWYLESIRPNETSQEDVNAANCNHP